MSSKQSTIDFILEQITNAGTVYAKKMFGEYAIYCDEMWDESEWLTELIQITASELPLTKKKSPSQKRIKHNTLSKGNLP